MPGLPTKIRNLDFPGSKASSIQVCTSWTFFGATTKSFEVVGAYFSAHNRLVSAKLLGSSVAGLWDNDEGDDSPTFLFCLRRLLFEARSIDSSDFLLSRSWDFFAGKDFCVGDANDAEAVAVVSWDDPGHWRQSCICLVARDRLHEDFFVRCSLLPFIVFQDSIRDDYHLK